MKKSTKTLLYSLTVVPAMFMVVSCQQNLEKNIVGFELFGNEYTQYVQKGTDIKALSITPIYEGGTKGEALSLAANMVSGYDKDKVGSQKISITYEGQTQTADIFVANRKVEVADVNALYNAINNQAEGDFILLANGDYNIDYTRYNSERNVGISNTNFTYADFYMLIDKNHVKLSGSGNTKLYSSLDQRNGSWNFQNFITVAGEDVTLDNLKIVSKTEVNKVIEMTKNGKDFRLTNTTISAPVDTAIYGDNTEKFAGSVYFNVENAGNIVFKNVTLDKGRISFTGAKQGNISFENTLIDYTDCDEWLYEEGTYASFGPVGAFFGEDKSLTATSANELTVKFDATKYSNPENITTLKNQLPQGTNVVVINETV